MSIAGPRGGPRPKSATALVTDARDVAARGPPRPQIGQRAGTGQISVDGVLQYSSDIPSAQRRGPPGLRPIVHSRTPSGRHPLDPRLAGRQVPQHLPPRTSKLSEKLVLLPEADESDLEKEPFELEEDDDAAPPKDEELTRRRSGALKGKTYAEKLSKTRRAEKLSRCTAYCTAQSYKMRPTADFIKSKHGARTKLYDDCLYVVYQMPLIGGLEGYRVRSSPILRSPGGKSVLDEEIERNERRRHHDSYFDEETEEHGVRWPENRSGSPSPIARETGELQSSPLDNHRRNSSPNRIPPNALMFGEMYVFSYGVVVFWNFSERQEKDLLADLTFSTGETGVSLATRPQLEEDFETEAFHFEYNENIERPRIFNDMISLRSGDHMIKLAISHAIAQSTKLSFFEERMATTMAEAQYVPRRLALTGRLGMKREDVVKILGRLFTSRVDVNLSSNVLDIPNFFWDSEPTLHPLYTAVREYLEIKPRIQILNERCRVFLDLAEILSDAIADKKMTHITWIIIVLIVISILVTCSEVFLRFGILNKDKALPTMTIVGNTTSSINMSPDMTKMGTMMPGALLNLPSRSFARVTLISSWILMAVSSLS